MKNQNWLTLWNDNDLRPLMDLRRDMDRLFEDFWSAPSNIRRMQNEAQYTPACDVEEQQDHYLLNVEMPGISKNDIRIEALGNQIVVSGERRNEREDKGDGARYSERRFGKFQRSFTLPSGVSADKIEAHYQDGILSLIVPKAESAKPRQIKISDGAGTSFFGKFLNQPKNDKEESRSSSDYRKDKVAS